MKKLIILVPVVVVSFLASAQKQGKRSAKSIVASGSTVAANHLAQSWKFGIALYTFHTVSFPEALAKADSSGVQYIEGFAFQKAGPSLKDSLIMTLSPSGIEQIYRMVNDAGFKMESIYIFAGNTVEGWKKQFDLAKQLQVKFVTAEPPVSLWNSIDSLAGLYNIKVAIHEHWKGMSPYWHPDSVLAALKGHPNFGVCADLGHWPKSGIDPVNALKKLAGHIIAIHLKDIAEYNNVKIQDVPVGTGVVKFPEVFNELKRQKFDGYIYIERDAEDKPDNLASVVATVKYYNDQLGLPQQRMKPFATAPIGQMATSGSSPAAANKPGGSSKLQEYEGTFKMPASAEVSIIKMVSRGDDLYIQPGDYPEMKLTPVEKDKFEEQDNNIQIGFMRKDGLITEVKINYQGTDYVGTKE